MWQEMSQPCSEQWYQKVHWMYILSCSWTSETSFTPNFSLCSSIMRKISSSCWRWISRSLLRSSWVIVSSTFCWVMRCCVFLIWPWMWLQNLIGSGRFSDTRTKSCSSGLTSPANRLFNNHFTHAEYSRLVKVLDFNFQNPNLTTFGRSMVFLIMRTHQCGAENDTECARWLKFLLPLR